MGSVQYVVVEKGYDDERVVFGPTSDKAAADKVASEHAARKVKEAK